MVEFSTLYLYIIFIILLSDILLILYVTEKIKCWRLKLSADFVKTMIIIIYTAYYILYAIHTVGRYTSLQQSQ